MGDDCRQALTRLHTYLDDECEAAIKATIQQHLHRCPPCLDRVDFELELRAVVARTCREQAPSHLVDRVLDALRP
jgi:mycothiol system anti-sigma-R factor